MLKKSILLSASFAGFILMAPLSAQANNPFFCATQCNASICSSNPSIAKQCATACQGVPGYESVVSSCNVHHEPQKVETHTPTLAEHNPAPHVKPERNLGPGGAPELPPRDKNSDHEKNIQFHGNESKYHADMIKHHTEMAQHHPHHADIHNDQLKFHRERYDHHVKEFQRHTDAHNKSMEDMKQIEELKTQERTVEQHLHEIDAVLHQGHSSYLKHILEQALESAKASLQKTHKSLKEQLHHITGDKRHLEMTNNEHQPPVHQSTVQPHHTPQQTIHNAPPPPPPPPGNAPPPPKTNAPKTTLNAPANSGGRGALLDAIRQDNKSKLKSAKDRKLPPKTNAPHSAQSSGPKSMLEILQNNKAFQQRRDAIHGSNDEQENDDEW